MINSSAIWFVVPAFNEGQALAAVLNGLEGFNVVVVDDGSADETAEIAADAGAHVCRHIVNLGQGAALQTGIDYALRHGADWIVTFDSDGQHRREDAVAMIEQAKATGVDVVLGSRFIGDAVGLSNVKRAFLRLATWFTRVQTGLALTDTHNGLRVFSRSGARAIRIRQNRMAHASEILEQIARQEIRFVEFPCTIIYTDYSRAKGQRMSGMFRILLDMALGRMGR